MKNRIYIILILLLNTYKFSYGQLDNIHYFNPIHVGEYTTATITQEFFYLSTPSTSNISITFTDAAGNPLTATVLNLNTNSTSTVTSPLTLNNANPLRLEIGTLGVGPMTVAKAQVGKIMDGNGEGVIFSSTGDFFVNYRARAGAQACSSSTKGNVALGKDFRWGGSPTEDTTNISAVGNMLSIMATEDNTDITISNLKPGMEFDNGTSGTPITGTTIVRTLQKGESFILYAPVKINQLSVQDYGWLGARIQSTKNVTVAVGGLMQQGGGNSRDLGFDQLVPTEQVGREYVVMEGNGGNREKVIVVATVANTVIDVNGTAGVYTLANAGDYVLIPNSYFNADGNMYLKSTRPFYTFHKIFGSGSAATNSLMFVPPLSCFGTTEVDFIPEGNKIGNATYNNSEVAILAPSSESVSVNGTTLANPLPVTGNTNWVSYRQSISGNTEITSTGAVQVTLMGASGFAGYGGYYSGFGEVPVITVVPINTHGLVCIGESILSVDPVTGASYQWYKDDIAITGANSNSYDISSEPNSGTYNVILTFPGGCEVSSNFVTSIKCPCKKSGLLGTPTEFTDVAISTREQSSNWPKNIPNSFLTIDSQNKGFVITRHSNPDTEINDAQEGMLIFDTTESCLKIYDGTSWSDCLEQTCNE
ncbi:MAG: IgGFc-binding protein [Flavobacteriales bacterium]|nr:IgGFc-binding protein [Flavobacteriales bacterium]